MTDKFACEFHLNVYEEDNHQLMFDDYHLLGLASSIPDLDGFMDDFFEYIKEDDDIKSLSVGEYHIFVQGTVEFESSRDWETGYEEGGFIFDWEDKNIFKHKEL